MIQNLGGNRNITKDESYYIVKVYGTEQSWSRSNPKVLEEPKPFTGYISSVDWAFQASKERSWAHRFKKLPPKIETKTIGPWWYTINKVEVIKVRREVREMDQIVSRLHR